MKIAAKRGKFWMNSSIQLHQKSFRNVTPGDCPRIFYASEKALYHEKLNRVPAFIMQDSALIVDPKAVFHHHKILSLSHSA